MPVPEGLTALDLDTLRLTAQFVARNGKAFLTGLAGREAGNPHFNFLKPTHSLFGFFTALCDAYSRVLMPPKPLAEQLRADAEDRCGGAAPVATRLRVLIKVSVAGACAGRVGSASRGAARGSCAAAVCGGSVGLLGRHVCACAPRRCCRAQGVGWSAAAAKSVQAPEQLGARCSRAAWGGSAEGVSASRSRMMLAFKQRVERCTVCGHSSSACMAPSRAEQRRPRARALGALRSAAAAGCARAIRSGPNLYLAVRRAGRSCWSGACAGWSSRRRRRRRPRPPPTRPRRSALRCSPSTGAPGGRASASGLSSGVRVRAKQQSAEVWDRCDG